MRRRSAFSACLKRNKVLPFSTFSFFFSFFFFWRGGTRKQKTKSRTLMYLFSVCRHSLFAGVTLAPPVSWRMSLDQSRRSSRAAKLRDDVVFWREAPVRGVGDWVGEEDMLPAEIGGEQDDV